MHSVDQAHVAPCVRRKGLRANRVPGGFALSAALAMCGAMMFATAAEQVPAGADADQAREWLMRMSRAMTTLNYDARFLHVAGSRAENLRIVHRVEGDAVTERLVSLDGGREIVRTPTELVCFLPDRRTVLVEKRRDDRSLLATVPVYDDRMLANYTLAAPRTARVLERNAQLVIVQPRDALRYGYRLWLDVATALPLKSQLCDHAGRVIEQVVLTDLQTPEHIDPAAVRSSIDTRGFRWLRQVSVQRGDAATDTLTGGWIVANAPQGFSLRIARVQQLGGSPGPVRHLVLSDGLASVSVFIEPHRKQSGSGPAPDQAARDEQLARVGSALAYSTDAPDFRVTAVGEVPSATLKAIAHSVRAAPAESAAAK